VFYIFLKQVTLSRKRKKIHLLKDIIFLRSKSDNGVLNTTML